MSTKAQTIKAVCYDIDGTMIDSEPLHVAAWHETLRLNGRNFADLPPEFQHTMAGRKPIAIATFMVENLGVGISPEEFLEQKHANFMNKVRTDLRPMPGVVESVHRLRREFLLGIGTALGQEYAQLVLRVLGVTDCFEANAIVTGDEIAKGKPYPETYQTLALRLGVAPNEMVVLEDASSGIVSAKDAGSWCIAVENTEAAPQDVSRADVVVHSLDEVTSELVRSVIK